ncbi:TonB-dependent receptor [Pacificimonas sp. ICDLI1SI03]
MRQILNILGGSSIIALAALAPTSALAQDVEAETEASEAEQGGINEIIVYAQRKSRGEELQDVPMAITAVNAQSLEQAHAVDVRDVGRMVPNAQLDGVGTFPGFANFFMRGVGVSTSVRSLDPAVNIVQDGMVIGYQAGAVLDTFDTESVEVLRGPQGVLFGRNASGGVVSLRSKRPTGDFGAEMKLTLGNAGTVETRTAVEGALVEDRVMARMAVLTRNNNGFFTNNNNGSFVVVPGNPNPTGAAAAEHPVEKFPETNEIVAKSTWVFKPGDTTTFTLLGQYLNFRDGGGATRSYFPEGAPPRQLQTSWGWTPEPGKWETNLGTTGYTNIEGFHVIGELEQDVGAGVVTALGAYRDISYNATLNVGGDPFDVLLFPDNEEDATQKSLEVRYNVDLNDRISLLVGGFYFHLDSDVFEKRLQKLPTDAVDRRYIVNIWNQDTKSFAFFGNVDFSVTDSLTLSAGVRYSKDTKKMHIVPLTICPGQSFDSCPRNFLDAEESWDDVSPRLVANWEVVPDIRVFASYSRGYRAGNFNARAPTAAGAIVPANPESVSSFETGVKSDLLDDTLRVNVNYFYQKYDEIQRLVQTPIEGSSPEQRLFNAASATIQGIEFETAFMPVYGLRFDANVGYTDAQYDSFDNLTLPAGVSVSDLKFDRVPKWTAFVGFTYDLDVGRDDTLSFHSGYSWRSHVFTDVNNDPLLEQDSYGLLDASITYEHDNWTFGIFGRNLANQEFAEIKSAGLGYNAFGGTPRYYGAQIGMEF